MSHRSSALILAMLLSGALTLSACYEDTEATGPAPVESTAASGGSSTAPDEGSTGSGQADPSKGATSASPLDQQDQDSSNDPDWEIGGEGEEAAEGSALTIAEVRAGSHDGYSRIVLEFEGEGTPGWRAPEWVDSASTMGKGDPITVKGDHTLVIHGTGTASIQPTGQGSGQQRLDLDKGDGDEGDEGECRRAVADAEEAFVDPGFEGEFQVVLGTDSQTYRVFTLSDPTRLVIDVADDDQQGQDGQGDQDHHDDDNS